MNLATIASLRMHLPDDTVIDALLAVTASYDGDIAYLNTEASGIPKVVRQYVQTRRYPHWTYNLALTSGWDAAESERGTRLIADADVLLAFWDGASRGTKDTIDKARRKGIDVWIVGREGTLQQVSEITTLAGDRED